MDHVRRLSRQALDWCAACLFAMSALYASGAIAQARDVRVESLQWMAGHWIDKRPSGDVEEVWLAPKAGVMLAMNRSVRQGAADFEFLRIAEVDGKLIYFASPRGRAPVPFTAVEASAERVVFENTAHDFPQRILYWREGEALVARIEGPGAGGKPRGIQWKFVRAP